MSCPSWQLDPFDEPLTKDCDGQDDSQSHGQTITSLLSVTRCHFWLCLKRFQSGYASARLSENSRRLWLFPGRFGGSRGKLRENCWKFFPNREMLQILGFRAPGKANLPGTLGRHCLDLVRTFRTDVF